MRRFGALSAKRDSRFFPPRSLSFSNGEEKKNIYQFKLCSVSVVYTIEHYDQQSVEKIVGVFWFFFCFSFFFFFFYILSFLLHLSLAWKRTKKKKRVFYIEIRLSVKNDILLVFVRFFNRSRCSAVLSVVSRSDWNTIMYLIARDWRRVYILVDLDIKSRQNRRDNCVWRI